MSTAGKVLSVLVMLMSVVWILLSAGVAELNRNGTKAVANLKAESLKLEEEVAKADREVITVKDSHNLEQVKLQNQLTEIDAARADAEKVRSERLETLSRVTIQQADAESQSKMSESHRDLRVAEKAAETKAKADAEAEVEKLKTQRTELVGRLTALRDKFKATLDANRSQVERLRKAPASRASLPASVPAT